MRALVFGAGRMGAAAAWDLARQPGVTLVRVLDRDLPKLAALEHGLGRLLATQRGDHARVETEPCDLDREPSPVARLRGFDVALALPTTVTTRGSRRPPSRRGSTSATSVATTRSCALSSR